MPFAMRFLSPREHAGVLRKRDKSGGVGADEVDDGDDANDHGAEADGSRKRKDAIHVWEFCDGKLGVLLFNDIMSIKGGGDASHYGDVIIPDGGVGMTSSIPGGPGCRGMGGVEDVAATNDARASRSKARLSEAAKRSNREDQKVDLFKGCVATMQAQQEADAKLQAMLQAQFQAGVEERREKMTAEPDVAAQLATAYRNVMVAQKDKDNLTEGCDPEVVACVDLALRLRKEMSKLMSKAGAGVSA